MNDRFYELLNTVFAKVKSTGDLRSRMCHIGVSDDATCFGIMKSRLGTSDADATGQSVPVLRLFLSLPVIVFLWSSTHHFGLYWLAGLRD